MVFLGPIFSPGQPQRALENTGAFPLGFPPMSSQRHGATTSLPASTSVCLCRVGLHWDHRVVKASYVHHAQICRPTEARERATLLLGEQRGASRIAVTTGAQILSLLSSASPQDTAVGLAGRTTQCLLPWLSLGWMRALRLGKGKPHTPSTIPAK